MQLGLLISNAFRLCRLGPSGQGMMLALLLNSTTVVLMTLVVDDDADYLTDIDDFYSCVCLYFRTGSKTTANTGKSSALKCTRPTFLVQIFSLQSEVVLQLGALSHRVAHLPNRKVHSTRTHPWFN